VAALVSRQAPRAGWSQRSGRRLTATRKDASVAPSARQGVSSGGALPQRRVDDSLRLGKDRLQVAAAFEAFAVDLVDVLGTGRSCGEPAVVGDHLDTANRRVVAGRLVEHLADGRARQRVGPQLAGLEFCQPLLLGLVGRGLDAAEEGPSKLCAQATIVLRGIVAVARREFRGEQRRYDAVLVGRPHRAVAAQEARTGAFLAAQAEAPVEQAAGEPLEADG